MVETVLRNFPDCKILGSDLIRSRTRATAQRYTDEARFRFVLQEQLLAEAAQLSTPPIAVIHNGACSSTLERDPEVFRVLNVESSQSLWNYCADLDIPYLYASSASVYGDGKLGFSDEKSHCSKFRALNLYGDSKLQFDRWVLEQERRPKLWFGLRYFNVFGAFEEHKGKQASMILQGYRQIQERGWVGLFRSNDPKFEDGKQQRDFVYVKDVCEVTLRLLQGALEGRLSPESGGRFINIGRGVAATWLELIGALFKAVKTDPDIRFIDMPDELKEQYQNYTKAELGGLQDMKIDHRFLNLEEAVADYVNTHLSL